MRRVTTHRMLWPAALPLWGVAVPCRPAVPLAKATPRAAPHVVARPRVTPSACATPAPRKPSAAPTPLSTTPFPALSFTEFRLQNGLRVVLHEDHSTPIVAVNVWYHVGSKNEVPGRTGFAHLFEHLMFQGSRHYNDDYFKPLQEAGGTLNATTNSDRTNFWEVVPSNFLELALSMEADRMGYLLEALTEEKFNNQREVVKNEKRQNYDNRPYGLAHAKIAETLYPPQHPYHWLTIGSLDDISAATIDDVKAFFRNYYVPNNASVVIAGDFVPEQVRRYAEKYFGALPTGLEVRPVTAPPPQLEHETRVMMEDAVAVPRLYLAWPTVPQWSPDEAPLEMLAHGLADGKTARLYKTLVYDRQIAQDVSVFSDSREIAGQFVIAATARPGKSLADIENAIDAELEKLKASPPTPLDLEHEYNAWEARFFYDLQTVNARADQFNRYATLLNRPGYFAEDLARYRRVTSADIQRVINRYLTDKRVVLSVVPAAQHPNPTGTGAVATVPAASVPPATLTTPAASPATASAPATADGYQRPQPQPDPPFKLPQMQRRRLSNGLEVLIVEHHGLPVVNFKLVVKAGAAADPPGRAGLAAFTADMLDEGTGTRSALVISNELAGIGALYSTDVGWDVSALNLMTLSRHLDQALGVYASLIADPVFPAADLERLRASRLASFQQRRANPAEVAATIYASLLYGSNHPYGHLPAGGDAAVNAIQQDDVQQFYDTYYRPNNAALIVVGDVQPDTLLPKLERAFFGWKRSAATENTVIPAVPQRAQAAIYLVDKPGAAQSVITIGQVAVPRLTPDYFPLIVLNNLLGGQFTSRVNLNLREAKGYTYGARTTFSYRRGAGPFAATAGVQTAVTRDAVVEFLKELSGVRGALPITEAEVEYARQSIIRGFPRSFETPAQIADHLADAVLYDLPASYFDQYLASVRAVTLDDVRRVATRYIDPAKMTILIVGDRKAIEPGLRSLDQIGTTLTVLDTEGHPVT